VTEQSKQPYRAHVCDSSCAHTIDIGYVHTPDDQGVCLPTCPHPHHKDTFHEAWKASTSTPVRCRITTPHAHSSFDDPIDCPLQNNPQPARLQACGRFHTDNSTAPGCSHHNTPSGEGR
jgi:hypothetical protein